ncbi:alpha-mannosidase [Rubripirellula amarantea]|uniref:Alpha-mannosidase n=1 Tax=Rubripirellula amarantea TaxID=2527999 RepID=A0A5C5WSG2_9BACT|nr:glycosyl hydrolase-related protein [Rubripirellula amarantea]TWT53101.1 alpha-mannosidase [Rubripirellula amarantea]
MSTRRNFIKAAGLTLAASRRLTADDATVKRIYIAADDHTDYMWTADERTYRESFLRTLDHYLDLADATDDRDNDYQSRWNCDGLLWFREYEQNRSTEAVERLVKRIKSGHISVPMTMLVSCYGGMPTEAVLRGMYYGGHVERRYKLELPIAVAMENQTLPFGLASLWAGCGVKYSWKGICACVSKVKDSGTRRKHDVYWWIGPDGERILMKWYSLAGPLRRGVYANEGPGGYAEARYPKLAIEYVESDKGFQQQNPHDVIGLFGQGWDDLETIVPLSDVEKSFPSVAEDLSTKTRRVIVSNERDYFEDFAKSHGDDLPQVSCSYGNEWDLYCASLAEVTATVVRATEKLRTAESMAVLATSLNPTFKSKLDAKELEDRRQQAWIAYGLYWEHDWTADGPISRERRAAWQRKIAKQITDYIDTLYDLAAAELSHQIAAKNPRSFAVFNSLGWTRADVVEFELDQIPDPGQTFGIFDVETNQPLASQIQVRGHVAKIQFVATEIPSFGYRVYEVRDLPQATETVSPTRFRNGKLISQFHELTVTQAGAITDWKSLVLDQVLVSEHQVANHLEDAKGKMTLEWEGPVSTVVRIDVARPIKRQTRIKLYESLDRLDIENQILENFSELQKWQFQFNLDNPQTRHEELGVIMQADTISRGGNYADENARTDWLTLNHFVTVQGDQASVTIANRDCRFFHLGVDTNGPMDPRSQELHILAGGQVDGQELGIQEQGGDREFTQRFSLFADQRLSDVDAMKRSLEFANPMTVVLLKGAAPKAVRPIHQSLVTIESDSVIIWAIKPAEQGSGGGTIVRLWNLANQSSMYALNFKLGSKKCTKTTHVETDIAEVQIADSKVTGELETNAMQTLRFATND